MGGQPTQTEGPLGPLTPPGNTPGKQSSFTVTFKAFTAWMYHLQVVLLCVQVMKGLSKFNKMKATLFFDKPINNTLHVNLKIFVRKLVLMLTNL